MKSNKLREMIDKYEMYLTHQNKDIGLRMKPENIEELKQLKKLKPELLAELLKIEEEQKIAGDPRIGSLSLNYYYGDWYRANSIFKIEKDGGNMPDWGNNCNIFQCDDLNRITANFYFEEKKEGYVDYVKVVNKLEEMFNCDLGTKAEELQKRFPDLLIVMRSYNDMRGEGQYVSEIIFPDFVTFEKYVYQAFEKAIQKNNEYKAKVEAIFETAKKTGEKQLIAKYPVDCDSDEECNIDLIYEYAMPDGTKKYERIHTY